MGLPGWWPARKATVDYLTRRLGEVRGDLVDAERQAATAVVENRRLRAELVTVRQRLDETRARAASAEERQKLAQAEREAVRAVEAEHSRMLRRVRELLDNITAYTHGRRPEVATSVSIEFVYDLAKILDGGGAETESDTGGGRDVD